MRYSINNTGEIKIRQFPWCFQTFIAILIKAIQYIIAQRAENGI